MDRRVQVYVDLDGVPILAGRLWSRVARDREGATFEYDQSWLAHPNRFQLEPALMLGRGPHHTPPDKALFGAIGDSAPDRWGRTLMRRAERSRARRAQSAPRTLREIDYLLMVDDESRQGALRFSESEAGPFLAEATNTRIPPIVALPKLLAASGRVEGETAADEDLRLLLAPGSSLGGARPKASVRERDGGLAIAKFPSKTDEIPVERWEAVALTLAAKAGIQVPVWRVEDVSGQAVLILRRFDREAGRRVPFLSAMSMLNAHDRETRSYLEIADAIRQHGARPKRDLEELWRRIVFNVLISNTDDHLRNHAFLYPGADGWRLAPAYDLNPVPTDIKPRILSTAIDLDDTTASIDLAFDVAPAFGLTPAQARAIAREVGAAAAGWRTAAAAVGLSAAEADRMASAFEHDDLERARLSSV
jgi:serine/threonine-protein kinase HipA